MVYRKLIFHQIPRFLPWIRCLNSWALAIRNEYRSSTHSPHKVLSFYSAMHRGSGPFDSFSILATVKSCASFKKPSVIHHLHAHIIKLGFSAHVYVATAMLHAYASSSIGDARKLFDDMPEKNVVSWSTMIIGYARSGSVADARRVFDRMPMGGVASWSAMITAYVNNGSCVSGLELFREMMITGLRPDEIAIVPVLSGCAHMGPAGLLLGKSVHSITVKNGWEKNVETGTALLDMYAKCGFLKYALHLFKLMKERNVITWTSLICGLAQHGHSKDALSLFEMMQQIGVRPNEMSFTGILSACIHTGLVEEGRKYFRLIETYGLKPQIQHYGCMVDLLGKAGLLEEAYDTIQSMELEPNVFIWSSYLAACKAHKQFEMADRVIDRVLTVLKPQNGGVYTLISDIYVLNKKWDDAERIRQLMVTQKAQKVRGSSFIKTGS